jgi:predicted dehydrogenase
MKKKFKTLIVGAGKIAFGNSMLDPDSHYGAFTKSKKAKVEGIVDLKKNVILKIRSEYNVKVFNNLKLALKSIRPDIISICTPDQSHFNVCYSIINSQYFPKIIFLEKPCFQNSVELTKISKEAKKKNIEIIVNHTRRFDDNFKILKSNIKKNFFGSIQRVYFTYYNGWLHNAVHNIDILNYLFDDLLIKVKSKKSFYNKNNLDVILKFKKNLSLVFATGYSESPYQIFDIDLHFKNFRLLIDNFGKNAYLQKRETNLLGESFLSNKKNIFKKQKISPMRNAVRIIIKFLETKNKNVIKDYNINTIGRSMKSIW